MHFPDYSYYPLANMKLRPLLILLLFVVSTGILAWIYYTATHGRERTRTNPWTETISDLDACCRRKHVKSLQYDRFAAVANSERHLDAARLFRAMALSDRLQEYNCATVIVRLGGQYKPPEKIMVFHSDTKGNLERSIAYERQQLDQQYGADVDRAVDGGNRYAARALIWAGANDLGHLVLMQHCLTTGPEKTASEAPYYLVCPECGNTYASDYCSAYCPYCLTDGRRFIRVE